MGTHRSKHNKGRKPLYKEYGSLPDKDVPWWAANPAPHAVHKPAFTPRRLSPPKVAVELTESVRRFLESRRAGPATLSLDPLPSMPERVISGEIFTGRPENNDGARARASTSDILLQLYTEEYLTIRHYRAGRIWQRDMESATIQPNLTINWAEPARGMHYQRRGDLTEYQWEAMGRRRAFAKEAGAAVANFLDAALDANMGRRALTIAFGLDSTTLGEAITGALDELSIHLGFDIRWGEREVRVRGWRVAA